MLLGKWPALVRADVMSTEEPVASSTMAPAGTALAPLIPVTTLQANVSSPDAPFEVLVLNISDKVSSNSLWLFWLTIATRSLPFSELLARNEPVKVVAVELCVSQFASKLKAVGVWVKSTNIFAAFANIPKHTKPETSKSVFIKASLR